MKRSRKLSAYGVTFALVTALALFHPRDVSAKIDYESFRQDLIDFVETYGTDKDSELIDDLYAMSLAELETYYFALSDPSVFAKANEQAEARASLQKEMEPRLQLKSLHAPSVGYPPDYPSGGNYAVYTATLPGLGILLNGSQNRTDASAVGGAWIAFDTLEFAAIVAQAACDAALLGAPAACPVAGTANAAARADQVVLQQANYQDDLIDNAEIEAAFENSKTIIDQGNALSVDLATHDADIKSMLANIQAGIDANSDKLDILLARQLEVVRLLLTPQGRRATDVPACNDGPCSWPNKKKIARR